jgi:hypothetical protein
MWFETIVLHPIAIKRLEQFTNAGKRKDKIKLKEIAQRQQRIVKFATRRQRWAHFIFRFKRPFHDKSITWLETKSQTSHSAMTEGHS